MHAISGLLKLASGEITYDGNLISKMERNILDGVNGTVINIDIFNRKQLTH